VVAALNGGAVGNGFASTNNVGTTRSFLGTNRFFVPGSTGVGLTPTGALRRQGFKINRIGLLQF
jgi:hypothetical protein